MFLIGLITEHLRMYADGIRIDRNTFMGVFYTLTGFHGFHVCMGLVAPGIVAALAFRGDYRAGRRRVVVDTVSIYCHFVDAVWVFVLSIVYVWPHLQATAPAARTAWSSSESCTPSFGHRRSPFGTRRCSHHYASRTRRPARRTEPGRPP